jgi:hypothetical protein
MVATGYFARLAFTNSKTWVELSRSPVRTRRRLFPKDTGTVCQDLPLQANLLDFSPQAHKLLPFIGRQPVVPTALIPIGLLEPALDRLHRGPELARELFRPAPGSSKLDDLLPVLRRVWRMGSRHCGLLSTSIKVSTLPGQLQLTPALLSRTGVPPVLAARTVAGGAREKGLLGKEPPWDK